MAVELCPPPDVREFLRSWQLRCHRSCCKLGNAQQSFGWSSFRNLLAGPPCARKHALRLRSCSHVPSGKKNNHCAEDQDVKRSNFHPFRHPCSLELFFSIISKHSACPIHQHQNTTLQKDPWMDNLCGSSKSLPLTWGSRGQWTRDPLQVDLSFGSRAGRKGRQQHRPRNRLFFDVRGRQE